MFAISSREFVTLSHWRVLPDGRLVVFATDTTHPDVAPSKGAVRGKLVVSGVSLTPRPDGKSCACVFLIRTDLSGSLPSVVVQSAMGKQCMMARTIAKVPWIAGCYGQCPVLPCAPHTLSPPYHPVHSRWCLIAASKTSFFASNFRGCTCSAFRS